MFEVLRSVALAYSQVTACNDHDTVAGAESVYSVMIYHAGPKGEKRHVRCQRQLLGV